MRAGLSSDAGVRAERTRLLEVGLARARSRIARRVRAIEGDLARIVEADESARRAQLFVAAAAAAPRGTPRLTATDWSSGEPVDVSMSLDRATSPKAQVDAVFRRARRLKNGAAVAQGRLRDANRTLAELQALATRLAGEPEVDLDDLARMARTTAPRDFVLEALPAAGRHVGKDAPALPYRTFLGTLDAPIFVGRGAAHNDELTLHVARPHHLWLHARGQAGAHVVVPLRKGHSCPAELLVDAAHLAAHFSKARGEAVVEVTYVARRYVRKPRGSPPGLVEVTREKILVLRPSSTVLQRLLDRELAR
ncbi:MAG: NFACT RNA binding domain-containing protein [Polyangiaceae bacterium]